MLLWGILAVTANLLISIALLERILDMSATTDDMVSKLSGFSAQLDKITAEVQAVKDALAAALAAGNTVPAALVDAINAVGVKIQAVDDLNADAPV